MKDYEELIWNVWEGTGTISSEFIFDYSECCYVQEAIMGEFFEKVQL